MTDAEIIKALECCKADNDFANCDDCPYYAKGICLNCAEIADLINRLQADKEALIAGQETLQKALAEKNAEVDDLKKHLATLELCEKSNDELRSALKKKDNELKAVRHYYNECVEDLKKAHAEINELTEKLECLLCHATGSKLSKSTYSLRTMESAVNDEVQECCEEARAEAIKEFAERLKEIYATHDGLWITIDNLVKEMVGDANIATTTETEGDTE